MAQASKSNMYAMFFDTKNIDYIQNTFIETVYKVTNGKYNIERQSDTQLKIIMTRIHDNNAPYSEDKEMIKPQLNALNRELINKCMKLILSELKQRVYYLTKEIDGDGNRINTDPTLANQMPSNTTISNQILYSDTRNENMVIPQQSFSHKEIMLGGMPGLSGSLLNN